MPIRDIEDSTLILYRYQQIYNVDPADQWSKNYGPKPTKYVYRYHGDNDKCFVSLTNPDGQELSDWFPIAELGARMKSEAASEHQLASLEAAGIVFDPLMIDRKAADALLREHEHQQLADRDLIREAKQEYGLHFEKGVTVGEVIAGMKRVEAEDSRVENNEDDVGRLRKLGYSLDDNVSDQELRELESLVVDFESARDDAKEWHLPARVIPKLPLDHKTLARETAILQQWTESVQYIDNEQLGYRYDRRPPAHKRLKAALVAYYEGLRADRYERSAEPEAVVMGLIEEIEANDGIVSKKPVAESARTRSPAASADKPSKSQHGPTAGQIFLGIMVFLVVTLLVAGAIV